MKKIVLMCLGLLVTNAAWADGLDSQHKDWNVFSITQDGSQICYMTSSPKKEAGTWKNRSEPYVLVTSREDDVAEVSVSSGYPYKKGSKAKVVIEGKGSYDFFTSDETPKIAWAKDAAEDKRVVKDMIRGVNMVISAESAKGTWSKDTYSLYGFTQGFKRMQELCKNLRLRSLTLSTSVPAVEKKDEAAEEADETASEAEEEATTEADEEASEE